MLLALSKQIPEEVAPQLERPKVFRLLRAVRGRSDAEIDRLAENLERV